MTSMTRSGWDSIGTWLLSSSGSYVNTLGLQKPMAYEAFGHGETNGKLPVTSDGGLRRGLSPLGPEFLPMKPLSSSISTGLGVAVLLIVGGIGMTPSARASDECSDISGQIEVDRPDVTNSSLVVPTGSIQIENGLNWSDERIAKLIDGTNTRVRFGLGGCTEFLVDLPVYLRPLNGTAVSGFSDMAPAVKHQFAPLPGDIQLSATLGADLPTGATAVAGHGYVPYLQFPWSHELRDGWSLSGMLTTFWSPEDSQQHVRVEPTLVLEREIDAHSDLFLEYVGEYFTQGAPAQSINTGGAYRVTRLQQIDFHLAFGLNLQAPRYVFGIGYSVRWDGVL